MIKVNTKKVKSAKTYLANSRLKLKEAEADYKSSIVNINVISDKLCIENGISAKSSEMFEKLYLRLSEIESVVEDCMSNYERVERRLLDDAKRIK